MHEYEVTVILKSNISEEDHAQLIERIETWLVPNEESRATLLKPKHWGLRKMAYPIQKHVEGYYAFYEVMLDTDVIDNIERSMQYNESILRYMFIRKEDGKEQEQAPSEEAVVEAIEEAIVEEIIEEAIEEAIVEEIIEEAIEEAIVEEIVEEAIEEESSSDA